MPQIMLKTGWAEFYMMRIGSITAWLLLYYFAKIYSDHYPISYSSRNNQRGTSPFKFKAMETKHENLEIRHRTDNVLSTPSRNLFNIIYVCKFHDNEK